MEGHEVWDVHLLGTGQLDRQRSRLVARQPDLLVNNRTGAPGDFDTPEQTIGRCQFERPWESCITLGTQWSWLPNDSLKPYADALRLLVACAVGDGNLALNTNPMPDGRIEPRQVESFRQIGRWLKQYGESIYRTRGGPFVAPGGGRIQAHSDKFAMPSGSWWGGSTHQGNTIYLHILRWPAETITLPAISEPYDRVQEFELQVMDRGEWRAFHHGTTIGENLALKFAPVTGRHVRLNLRRTTDGPSIWEFQLFAPNK